MKLESVAQIVGLQNPKVPDFQPEHDKAIILRNAIKFRQKSLVNLISSHNRIQPRKAGTNCVCVM